LGLLVLSFAGTEQLAQRVPHWTDLFARVHASATGPHTLYRVVRYLHSLGDERVRGALQRVLHSIMESERAEAIMKTAADVLREQGYSQGLAKGEARGEARGEAKGEARGEARGLAKALLRLLEARGVRVDDASRQLIQGCRDIPTLERWLERALGATRLSEVLDGPAQ
jgi:hypothetical protein